MCPLHHWCAAGTVADLEDASWLYRPLAIARLRTVRGGRAVEWNRDWPGRTLVSRGMARAGDQMVFGPPVLGTGLCHGGRCRGEGDGCTRVGVAPINEPHPARERALKGRCSSARWAARAYDPVQRWARRDLRLRLDLRPVTVRLGAPRTPAPSVMPLRCSERLSPSRRDARRRLVVSRFEQHRLTGRQVSPRTSVLQSKDSCGYG
jgi:hypothetical protein